MKGQGLKESSSTSKAHHHHVTSTRARHHHVISIMGITKLMAPSHHQAMGLHHHQPYLIIHHSYHHHVHQQDQSPVNIDQRGSSCPCKGPSEDHHHISNAPSKSSIIRGSNKVITMTIMATIIIHLQGSIKVIYHHPGYIVL